MSPAVSHLSIIRVLSGASADAWVVHLLWAGSSVGPCHSGGGAVRLAVTGVLFLPLLVLGALVSYYYRSLLFSTTMDVEKMGLPTAAKTSAGI